MLISSAKMAISLGPYSKLHMLATYESPSSLTFGSTALSFSNSEAGADSCPQLALSGLTYCFLMIFLLGNILNNDQQCYYKALLQQSDQSYESAATCEIRPALGHLPTGKDHFHPGAVDVGEGQVVLAFEDGYKIVEEVVFLQVSLGYGTGAVQHCQDCGYFGIPGESGAHETAVQACAFESTVFGLSARRVNGIMQPSSSVLSVDQQQRKGSVGSDQFIELDLLKGQLLNPSNKVTSILSVALRGSCHSSIEAWYILLKRIPDPSQLVIVLYEPIGLAFVVGHEEVLPLFVTAEPISLLHCDIDARPSDVQVGRLKHLPFVLPDEVYLFLRELILSQQCDDPSEELAFVGVVEVISIIVCVGVAFGRFGDVCDVGNCSDLACSFVEEDPPGVLDHSLPVYLIKSFPQLRQDVRIFLLPDVAERQCCPEHFAVVECRHSAFEIVSWINSYVGDCDPRQESGKAGILLVEVLQGSGLELDQAKHIQWLVDLINELCAVQNKGHDAQMNAFLAAGSELMQ